MIPRFLPGISRGVLDGSGPMRGSLGHGERESSEQPCGSVPVPGDPTGAPCSSLAELSNSSVMHT